MTSGGSVRDASCVFVDSGYDNDRAELQILPKSEIIPTILGTGLWPQFGILQSYDHPARRCCSPWHQGSERDADDLHIVLRFFVREISVPGTQVPRYPQADPCWASGETDCRMAQAYDTGQRLSKAEPLILTNR